MNYEKTTIGLHCTVTSSKRFHASERTKDGVPFYCSKEIIKKVNGEKITECDYISEDAYNRVKEEYGVPQTGDLLITTRGTYGIPYIYKEYDKFYFADGNLTWLKDFDDKLDAEYLYYWINSYEGQKKIDAIAKGTAQKAVPIALLKEIEIVIPENPIQKKVVVILKNYDQLIENNKKQIKLLEEAAQRLYKEWFIDLRFPGYENCKIVDGVPESWIQKKISDLGEIITGKTPSTSKEQYYGGNIPFVKIPDMHDCVFPITTEVSLTNEGANTQKNKFIPKNGIMVSCIATVGLVNIAIEPCQTNQQINSIILNNEQDLYYVYSSMKRLKELLEGVGSNGATMTNVNKTKFGKLEVVYPNDELRKLYYNYCKPIFEKIYALSRSIKKLSQARDCLLPKLMSGEIEV